MRNNFITFHNYFQDYFGWNQNTLFWKFWQGMCQQDKSFSSFLLNCPVKNSIAQKMSAWPGPSYVAVTEQM